MNYSQIIEIINAAGRAGAKHLKFKDLEVSFWQGMDYKEEISGAYGANLLTDQDVKHENSPRSVPFVTSQKELNDLTLEERELIKELQQSHLMLTDPEKFEDMVETE